MFRRQSPAPEFPTLRPRTSGGAAWRACILTAVSLAALAGSAGASLAEPPDPNTVKAEMLCNMAKFVQWPDAIMAANRGQLVVAVLGEDDLAASIASVLSSRSVNGKPVFVRFARRVQDIRGCQIVYIAASEIAHAPEVVEALRGTPTLTLADTDGFAAHGGMVDFSGVVPNLRFEICQTRAEQAGLKISSRLLALARVVQAGS